MCGVCLRVLGRGGGDLAEARRLGDAEGLEQVALVVGELGALGELAVG